MVFLGASRYSQGLLPPEEPPMSRRRRLASLALSLPLLFLAATASADEYDSRNAGHPLRIAAYILHPVGWAIDVLIMRPAHWLVSQEPLDEVFGHSED